MFPTILLYFCTSILTLLNFIEYCIFKAQTNDMSCVSSPLFKHFVTALKLQYLTILRRVSIEVQKYRSKVSNIGMISPCASNRIKNGWMGFLGNE